MTAVETVERGQMSKRPAIKPGDTVRVHVKVREGDKERIQVFEGLVIGMHRGGARATFTAAKLVCQGAVQSYPFRCHLFCCAVRCGGSTAFQRRDCAVSYRRRLSFMFESNPVQRILGFHRS